MRTALAIWIVCCLGQIHLSHADDWPQWRGADRRGVSRETGLLQSWSADGPDTDWTAAGLGAGYSSVAVSQGLVFTMGRRGQDVIYSALEEESGETRWRRKIGTTTRNTCATPTVDGDLLFVVDPDGELLCLRAASGELVWQRSYQEDFAGRMQSGRGYGESPLVDGDKLICTPGGVDAMLVALNKRTGALIWKAAIPDLGKKGRDGAGFSSPVLSRGAGVRQYVQLVGRGLVGVAAKDGRFLWGYNALANRTANIPTPVAYDDYVFAANGYNAGSAMLKLSADGQGGVKASEVYALGGSRFQNHHGGVALLDGYIYGGHGSNNGIPTCLDVSTGRVKWKRRGPGIGSAAVVCADGRLYFRYQNGVVALIEATPDAYRLKGRFQIPGAGGDSWAHPVVANGRLYLREQDRLLVYDIRATATKSQQPASSGADAIGGDAVAALRKRGAAIRPLDLSSESATSTKRKLVQYLPRSAPAPIRIQLNDRQVTESGLLQADVAEALKAVKRPVLLELSGTRISDGGLKQVAAAPSLRALDLELCREFTDQGLESLQAAKDLHVLILTGTNITNRGLSHLKPLSKLVALDLEICEGVTDEGCRALGELRQLKALVVKKTGFEKATITNSGLAEICRLTELELLNVYANRISDEGLAPLRRLKRLRDLDLSLLSITDKGLQHLAPLTELRRLQLLYATGFAGPQITDQGLRPLLQMTSLRSLNLIGAKVTDDGLSQLSSLKQLRRLQLVNTQATAAGVVRLRRALPECVISN